MPFLLKSCCLRIRKKILKITNDYNKAQASNFSIGNDKPFSLATKNVYKPLKKLRFNAIIN